MLKNFKAPAPTQHIPNPENLNILDKIQSVWWKPQIPDGPTERLKGYNKQLLISKDSGYFKGNILL